MSGVMAWRKVFTKAQKKVYTQLPSAPLAVSTFLSPLTNPSLQNSECDALLQAPLQESRELTNLKAEMGKEGKERNLPPPAKRTFEPCFLTPKSTV